MAGRTSEPFERMSLNQIQIRMAGERRVVAVRHFQVGFCQCYLRGHIHRISAYVAGFAAVDETRAAKIIDGCSWRIDIDLNDALVETLHAVKQAFERCGTESGQMIGD